MESMDKAPYLWRITPTDPQWSNERSVRLDPEIRPNLAEQVEKHNPIAQEGLWQIPLEARQSIEEGLEDIGKFMGTSHGPCYCGPGRGQVIS